MVRFPADEKFCALRSSRRRANQWDYQPLCSLEDVGAILEFLLIRRIKDYMNDTKMGMSERQFGFLSRLSTDDALRTFHDRVVGALNARRPAIVVSLDIQYPKYFSWLYR